MITLAVFPSWCNRKNFSSRIFSTSVRDGCLPRAQVKSWSWGGLETTRESANPPTPHKHSKRC